MDSYFRAINSQFSMNEKNPKRNKNWKRNATISNGPYEEWFAVVKAINIIKYG